MATYQVVAKKTYVGPKINTGELSAVMMGFINCLGHPVRRLNAVSQFTLY